MMKEPQRKFSLFSSNSTNMKLLLAVTSLLGLGEL
jgi:hypothetical protein